MSGAHLTEEEKELLRQYQHLSATAPGLGKRLAIEVIPPLIFMGFWFHTKHAIYLLIFIAVMVSYNVQRILRQYKNIKRLNSISKKAVGEIGGTNET